MPAVQLVIVTASVVTVLGYWVRGHSSLPGKHWFLLAIFAMDLWLLSVGVELSAGFLAQHRGMFSRLGTTPDKVEALREKHGIYMVGDSRMNIAGLNQNSVPILARAIIDVGI